MNDESRFEAIERALSLPDMVRKLKSWNPDDTVNFSKELDKAINSLSSPEWEKFKELMNEIL